MPTPEREARSAIEGLLMAAGWHVCDLVQAPINAHKSPAIRDCPLKTGYGFADCTLYVDDRAAGVIEAKKARTRLTGVETQSAKYTQRLAEGLPRWHNPLPFAYEATGIETDLTNGLDPDPRPHSLFAFHSAVEESLSFQRTAVDGRLVLQRLVNRRGDASQCKP